MLLGFIKTGYIPGLKIELSAGYHSLRHIPANNKQLAAFSTMKGKSSRGYFIILSEVQLFYVIFIVFFCMLLGTQKKTNTSQQTTCFRFGSSKHFGRTTSQGERDIFWDVILLRAMQGEELGEVVHLGVVADFYCFSLLGSPLFID